MKALEILVVSGSLLLFAYVLERARENGVLVQVLALAFLSLVVVLIVASVIWFEFHKPYGM